MGTVQNVSSTPLSLTANPLLEDPPGDLPTQPDAGPQVEPPSQSLPVQAPDLADVAVAAATQTAPRKRDASWIGRGIAAAIISALGGLGLVGVLHGTPGMLADGFPRDTLYLYLAGSMALATLAISTLSLRLDGMKKLGLGPSTPTGAVTFAAIALILGAYAARLAYLRDIGQRATDIMLLLGASLLLVLAVAFSGRMPLAVAARTGVAHLQALPKVWLASGIAVVAVAILTRLLYLDRFPIVNHGDEMMYMVYARGFRDGVSLNPFRVHEGLLHVELWNWLIAQVSRPFPDTVWAYRLTGAILGIIGVIATFLLGRRVLDPVTGLVGALVVAVMPLHIWASRNALDNITDAVALPLALWLADRAIQRRDRRDAIACGIVLGLGFYGYFGARVFPIVIAICMLAILFHRPFLRSVLDFVRLGLWTLTGFLVAAAPALGFFRSEPDSFFGRVRSVTDTGSESSFDVRFHRALEGLSYPLSEPGGIFFRAVSPKVSVLGSVASFFIGVGVCFWILAVVLRLIRRQPAWLTARPGSMLIAWAVIAIPISQSLGMESQRFLALTPIWALAVATGLVLSVRALAAWTAKPWIAPATAIVLVLAIVFQNLTWYFNDDREISSWGSTEASRFYDLGWRLRSSPQDTELFAAGWPEIMYERTSGMQFWAPGRDAHFTYLGPMTEDQPPFGAPHLASGQLLILGPSRRDEACLIVNANPHATFGAGLDSNGHLLYLVVTNDSTFPFRVDESPSHSTFEIVSPPTCAGTTSHAGPDWPAPLP